MLTEQSVQMTLHFVYFYVKEKERKWMWHSYSSFIYNQITPDVAGCRCVPYAQPEIVIFSTLMLSGVHDAFILDESEHDAAVSAFQMLLKMFKVQK